MGESYNQLPADFTSQPLCTACRVYSFEFLFLHCCFPIRSNNFHFPNRNQKGSVTFGNNQFSIFGETNEVSFIHFALTENVFVFFSVALIIAIYY